MATEPSALFLRDLSNRVADDRRKLEGAALWEVIQEEVANELDLRFHAGVEGQSQNTLKVWLQVESEVSDAFQAAVHYRIGLILNGKNLEAVVTIGRESAILEGRHGVMEALKASLAEQMAGVVLSGLQFPRVKA